MTSCLSRRWRYIWTSLSTLDMNDQSFRDFKSDLPQTKRLKREKKEAKAFKNAMNTVHFLRSRIQKFRLNLTLDYATSDVHSWIWAAVSHDVEDLYFCSSVMAKLPSVLFNSASLVILKLCASVELNVPETASLPTLKVVHLKDLYLCDSDINRLLSAAPVLQELLVYLSMDSVLGISRFSVVSSSLISLIIRSRKWNNQQYLVVIDAPKLEYLEFTDSGNDIANIKFKNTSSIVNANLRLRCSFQCHAPMARDLAFSLCSFCNIKVLGVSSFLLKAALANEHDICFNYLTKLAMSYCAADLAILPQILKRMPNLEALVLNKRCRKHTVTCEAWKQEKSEVNCLKYTLKTLELRGFEGSEAEMAVLEYFMENAAVLNEVRTSIDNFNKIELKRAFMKKLFTFPKCSNVFRMIVS